MHNSALKSSYPFGSVMQGRSWTEPSLTAAYKMGFNGKEKVDEIEGDGNSIDFGDRILDTRLGRWMSVDPLQKKYPCITPYNFCLNSPLKYNDPTGRSAEIVIYGDHIQINVNLVFYGPSISKLSAADVTALVSNAQKMLQDAISNYMATNKVTIDGKEYTGKESVVLNFTSEIRADEAQAKKEMEENTSGANNYYKIDDNSGNVTNLEYNKTEDPTGASPLGGNTGSLAPASLLDDNKKTISAILPEPVEITTTDPVTGVDKKEIRSTSNKGVTAFQVSTTLLHELMHGFGMLKASDGGDPKSSNKGHYKLVGNGNAAVNADGTSQPVMYGAGTPGLDVFKRRPSTTECSIVMRDISNLSFSTTTKTVNGEKVALRTATLGALNSKH